MLEVLLERAASDNVSDVFINSGKPPAFRCGGEITTSGGIVPAEDIDSFRRKLLSAADEAQYQNKLSFDCSCTLSGKRFRINFFTTISGPAMAVRPIKSGNSMQFEALQLPAEQLQELCQARRGMVLVTGATGSGKSTTLAAMVNYINCTSYRHILTLEDPIEYVFEDNLCRISQRELNGEDGAFAEALRSALRENPDVIVIGELRDAASMRTALNAAMTGHLVLATVHTSNAVQAVERIVSMFPEDMRRQLSEDVAQSLNCIISQRLIPAAATRQPVPALEILPATPTVKKLIANREFAALEDTLKRENSNGMICFNKSIFKLLSKNIISQEDALNAVDNQDEFQLLLKGMERGVDAFRARYGEDSQNGNFVDMKTLLKYASRYQASDLHLLAGAPPVQRINGTLRTMELPPMNNSDIRRLLFSIISRSQRIEFEEKRELDLAMTIKISEDDPFVRYRINGFYQRGSVGVVARVINSSIPLPEQLKIPQSVVNLAGKQQGLVLVTGPTGSGKSTTLASLIDHINRTSHRRIITIEDPIEYVHENKKSFVAQRELHSDTLSFAAALKYALRQDPDVILVGEMRDTETIAAAIAAAETGHLVFATIHANNSPQTVDRIIDSFPAGQQNQIRLQLSGVILGVISQRLLPGIDGKTRHAAFEVLIGTSPVQTLIRESKTHMLQSVMETSARDGMISMERALTDLCGKGLISYETLKSYKVECAVMDRD